MILQAVQHPFIISLWGVFQDTANQNMVMYFLPSGRLFTLLPRYNAAKVTLALNYLHSKNIIYRELKWEDVLLNFDGHTNIADFGFARSTERRPSGRCVVPQTTLHPSCMYIIGNVRYNESLIFKMLSGLPPFHEPDISPVMLHEKIAQGPVCIKWPAFRAKATDSS
ncbi:kinase-like domain-containing protein [Dichomitus squalens]|uniref:cAMP-dependent protein kinase n=1 Tax=Dichomitus squalens TaxID=114155 RepID=A0A4Q9M5F2_9APHY|nr:kinase-like domain-containing protein [Dichomitus squalens]